VVNDDLHYTNITVTNCNTEQPRLPDEQLDKRLQLV